VLTLRQGTSLPGVRESRYREPAAVPAGPRHMRTDSMEVVLRSGFTTADIEAVRRGLVDANRKAAGRDAGYEPFVFHLRDPRTGRTAGGAVGHSSYDWVFVELLHVESGLRGQGYGRRLMEAVEAFGRERGLVGIWLDTFSFQARPFYEKLGFAVFGSIEDHPLGGARHFMQKRFAPRSDRWSFQS
jgi:GNAT superfamily N-acetyltransferase